MKRLSYLLIVLFIVALAIPSLPYLGNTALAQDTLRVAKILDTQGDVKVYRAGGEKSFAAYKGMGLTQGDTIITGANGKVTLEVDKDKEMKIGPNTQLMISELVQSLRNNADKSSFNLKAGQVYTKVKSQLSPGAKYEIRTPTAVMGVRGTQFFVSLSNGVAEVITLEGQVVVTVSQPVTGPDGTVTTQLMQIQVQPNQIFVQSPDDPTQYDLATLTSNENLSLFVLETLQEINQQQPGLINPQLLENLTEQIEQARQEQQQQQEEQQQQQQPQDRGDSSSSGSGSSDHTPSITIAQLDDLNLSCGQTEYLSISATPADANLVYSVAGDEDIALVEWVGNTLNITGQTPGEITITITASKSGYLGAARSFTVTVNEAQPNGVPQFFSARTLSPDSFEIIFDQAVQLVNEEYVSGQITVADSVYFSITDWEVDDSNPTRLIVSGSNDDPWPSNYTTDKLRIADNTVKSVANPELMNGTIEYVEIEDGMGPRLLEHGAVITGLNTLELHFQENISANNNCEGGLLGCVSVSGIDGLTITPSQPTENKVTITFEPTLEVNNFEGLLKIMIAAGVLQDDNGNLNEAIDDQPIYLQQVNDLTFYNDQLNWSAVAYATGYQVRLYENDEPFEFFESCFYIAVEGDSQQFDLSELFDLHELPVPGHNYEATVTATGEGFEPSEESDRKPLINV